MPEEKAYLKSSVKLWDALRAKAGLDISHNPKSLRGYDDSILAELRHDLFADDPGAFRRLLADRKIAIEQLLTAFFRATAPFSLMLRRILQMYQMVAVSEGDENLKMVIQLDRMKSHKLEFDLEGFAQQVRAVEFGLVTQNARKWSTNDMWGLNSLIRDQKSDIPDPAQPRSKIDSWLALYRRRDHAFPPLPSFKHTGVPAVDELLLKIEDDLNGFITRGRELFGSYSEISFSRPLPAEDEEELWPAGIVRSAAHDFWPADLVDGLQWVIGRLIKTPDDELVLSTLAQVRDRMDALQKIKVTHQERIEKLFEILSLPVWKRREAMYSVWVCAVALLDLRPYQTSFHVKDGRLEFPFSPNKIATISQPEQPSRRIEFWSELRTPAANLLGKRKRAIQPDYRYRLIDGKKRAADVVVLECKQYKKSSASNFSEAIIDYARACPSASVILCNYGPVLDSVLHRVEETAPEVKSRVTALGGIRPERDGESRLRQALRSGLSHLIDVPDTQGWSLLAKVTIELFWMSSNTDLDLHLRQGHSWTNFRSPEGIRGTRYLYDQRGDQSGMSTERIDVQSEGSNFYSVFVHRYSGEASLQEVAARVTMIYGEEEVTFKVPDGAGNWWYVGELRPGFSKPIEINRIVEAPPTADVKSARNA